MPTSTTVLPSAPCHGPEIDQANIDRILADFEAKRTAVYAAEERRAERLQTIDPETVRKLLDNDALAFQVNFPAEYNPLGDEDDDDIDEGWWRSIKIESSLLDDSVDPPISLPVAHAKAYLIKNNVPYTFHDFMDEISEGCFQMARALYDQHGILLSRLQIGVWDDVFPSWAILLIDELYVTPSCRRQGIGQRLIQAMFDKIVEERQPFYALSHATMFFNADVREQLRDASDDEARALRVQHTERARAFWRSLNFGPVGDTEYMGWYPYGDRLSKQTTG